MRALPWDYAVRNLTRSHLRTALAIVGSALVVLLAIAAAGFARGMGASLSMTGLARNVVMLGAGSEESVERSEIPSSVPGIATASIPGIRERLGVPYVSPEIVFASEIAFDKGADERFFGTFRGVEPAAFLVHEQVRITEGRAPGPDEVMVGRLAATRAGVDDARFTPGGTVWLDARPFTIVGRFEAPGTVMEAEFWCLLQDLRVTTQRDNLSSVVLTLGPEGQLGDVDLFTKQRLDLELVAMPETDYYAKVFDFYAPVRWMVWTTAVLIAAGAFLGGLNTTYASFAARIREFASLQAIGYSRPAIVLSLVQESVLTAAAGSLLAAVVAMLALDGLAVSISMGAFGMVVDAPVVAIGLAAGLVLGVIGAIPPAIRCLAIPVAQALRAA